MTKAKEESFQQLLDFATWIAERPSLIDTYAGKARQMTSNQEVLSIIDKTLDYAKAIACK